MLTQAVKFNGITSTAYIAEYEGMYIISIPELAFSMQMDNNLSDEEMTDELIIHLFAILDEDECKRAGEAILSVIRTEQGENNEY